MTNPFHFFSNLYRSFRSPSPDKVILSTIGINAVPSSRMVLLKKYDETGFIFFTNIKSKKIQDIKKNNKTSLFFIDINTRVEITISGIAQIVEDEISDTYFASRSRSKQIAAWASKQSEMLHEEQALEQRVNFYNSKFIYDNVYRPEFWCGFKIIPNKFEFSICGRTQVFSLSESNDNWIMKSN